MEARWATRADASSADTIFALSTPIGRSAVAVIRISGPRARHSLALLAGRCPPPRVATLARLRDPVSGTLLDEGLALFFPSPASFTGEDSAELQVHGSPAVIAAVSRTLRGLAGVREARAGEFTRRALDNGKLDLARAEALADLINAQTDGQRRLAIRASEGGPAKLSAEWRSAVLGCAAEIEARLDFADEGDVDPLEAEALAQRIGAVAAQVEAAMAMAHRAARTREGFVVALCGRPNAGKSSLLNALVGREQAIVSPHPGTTRDTIEVCLDLAGAAVTFCDTAGIRDTSDPIERIGVERARGAAARADLVVWLDAPDVPGEPDPALIPDLRIVSKADMAGGAASDRIRLSVRTGEGIDAFLSLVGERASEVRDEGGDAVTLRARHVAVATAIAADLRVAAGHAATDRLEIAAAHLAGVLARLAELGSNTADEDVLDQVFGRFCIGK